MLRGARGAEALKGPRFPLNQFRVVRGRYDNAVMEAFFSTLKTELADQFDSHGAQVKRELFDYIEASYNPPHRIRRLATLGPPNSSVAFLPVWSSDGAMRVIHAIATMNEPLRMPQERFSRGGRYLRYPLLLTTCHCHDGDQAFESFRDVEDDVDGVHVDHRFL